MRAVFQRLRFGEVAKLIFFFMIIGTTGVIFLGNSSLMPSSLISVLMFFIFAPLVNAVERRGVPRSAAIGVLFLGGAALLTVGVGYLVPRITQEVERFKGDSDRYTSNLKERLRRQELTVSRQLPFLEDQNLTDQSISWLKASGGKVLSFLPDLASQLLMAALMVPFLTFIMLKEANTIRREVLSLVPNRYFETVYSLSSRILEEMGGYVAARILEAVLVTIMVTVGCMLFNIPYAILLGVFAGATNAIPYLGPLLGAVPGVLFAVLDPVVPGQLLYVSLIYVVANVVDMVLIFPLVVAKIVNLHPLIVVVCVIIGSQIFGIVGMIVAVPITSILKILLQEIYSRIYARNGQST